MVYSFLFLSRFWLCCQSNAVLIECFRKCSLLFYCLVSFPLFFFSPLILRPDHSNCPMFKCTGSFFCLLKSGVDILQWIFHFSSYTFSSRVYICFFFLNNFSLWVFSIWWYIILLFFFSFFFFVHCYLALCLVSPLCGLPPGQFLFISLRVCVCK